MHGHYQVPARLRPALVNWVALISRRASDDVVQCFALPVDKWSLL